MRKKLKTKTRTKEKNYYYTAFMALAMTTSNDEDYNDEQVTEIYDEIKIIDEKNNEKTRTKVKPCTLKKNPSMRLYWRILATMHEFGHSIARISRYFNCFARRDTRTTHEKERDTDTKLDVTV